MIQRILLWLLKVSKRDINIPATLCIIIVNENGRRFVSRVYTTAIISGDGVTVAVTVGQIVENFLQRVGEKEDADQQRTTTEA